MVMDLEIEAEIDVYSFARKTTSISSTASTESISSETKSLTDEYDWTDEDDLDDEDVMSSTSSMPFDHLDSIADWVEADLRDYTYGVPANATKLVARQRRVRFSRELIYIDPEAYIVDIVDDLRNFAQERKEAKLEAKALKRWQNEAAYQSPFWHLAVSVANFH